jgi:hypothetical protein
LLNSLTPVVGAVRAGLLTLLLAVCPLAWSYTLTCEEQGSFPELEKMIVQPATVTIDISSIGNHLYIKMDGMLLSL